MSELETIIDQLSDAALLEIVDSDPALLALQASTLANASIEARGGRAALQSRVAGAIDLTAASNPESPAALPTDVDALPKLDSLATASIPAELEQIVRPSSPEISPTISSPDPLVPISAPVDASSPSVPSDGSATAAAVLEPAPNASDLPTAPGDETAPASQLPPGPDAPAQPTPTDCSSSTSSAPSAPLPSPSAEETISAVDIDAILAATENTPDISDASVPVAAPPTELAATAPPNPEPTPEPQASSPDISSNASPDQSPTPTSAGAEDTVSTADIDAILAATGNVPDEAKAAASTTVPPTDPATTAPPTPEHNASSPIASSDPIPTSPSGSGEDTVSAADIDAILAATGNAPDEANVSTSATAPTAEPAAAVTQNAEPMPEPQGSVSADLPIPSSDPDPKPPSATVEETVSAADIDAILAATGNAPDEAISSVSAAAPPTELASTAPPPSEPTPENHPSSPEKSSSASSDQSPTPTSATAEDTVSAADIDAILAATGNVPSDNTNSTASATPQIEISAAAVAINVQTEAEPPVSEVTSPTSTDSSPGDEVPAPPNNETTPAIVEVDPLPSSRCDSPRRFTRNSGRRIKARQVAMTTVGIIILAGLGVFANHQWFSKPVVPAHARERRMMPAVAAVENCHSLYESTAAGTRPQLIRAIAPLTRKTDTAQSFNESLAELRHTLASPIAACQSAHQQAQKEFAMLTQLHDVPLELTADFEKFSLIMDRHQEFLGGQLRPEAFEQWYNDYERMTAIYARIRKQLAQLETASEIPDIDLK